MVKFRVKMKGLRPILNAYKEAIIRGVSAKVYKELGQFVVDMIYARTKSGIGLTSAKRGAQEEPLKALSAAYVSYRKDGIVSFTTTDGRQVLFKVAKPKGGKFFEAGRSNLTLTGQMLEALHYTSSDKGVRIFVRDNRRKEGKNTNADVAKYVQENGRPFLELSEKEVKIVQSRLSRSIRNEIRRLRKK